MPISGLPGDITRRHSADMGQDSERTSTKGHPADMAEEPAREEFTRSLRRALIHLYDPGTLRHSPLIEFLDLSQQTDTLSSLRTLLNEAIESLKPDSSVPLESNAWRIYDILFYRYIEQSPQREVANDLGLSVRQLRRLEKTALDVLAGYLWKRYTPEDRILALNRASHTEVTDALAKKRTPSRERELVWLEKNEPRKPMDLQELIGGIRNTIQPLTQEQNVVLSYDMPVELPLVMAQPTALRQALFHVLVIATHLSSGGQITLEVGTLSQRSHAFLRITTHCSASPVSDTYDAEDLKMARRLIEISGGDIEIVADFGAAIPFAANIVLPTAEEVPVLFVDDNVDTLRLLEHYLTGSRYRFIGTSDPQEALTLVHCEAPCVVVLDVMLPGIDGWELLGRLRAHPDMQDVPIVICTILPQEQMARMLGATAFLRKPVSQEGLLAVLDQQIAPRSRKSCQSS